MIFAKKSLGQNWLNSPSAIKKIVDAGNLSPTDLVIEVGPGKGVLTQALLEKGVFVVAIEKDSRLIDDLKEKFKAYLETNKLKLIEGDILDPKILSSIINEQQNYKVVANIPYYITGEIIRFFLTNKTQPTEMVILVQKEVAIRIVAVNKKESILSISVKAYGQPKIIAKVPAGSFIPKPKVDSAIIAIKNINRNFFTEITETAFFDIVKKGFSQKRKLLHRNLGLEPDKLIKCHLSPTSRAEDLTIEDWLCLTKQTQ